MWRMIRLNFTKGTREGRLLKIEFEKVRRRPGRQTLVFPQVQEGSETLHEGEASGKSAEGFEAPFEAPFEALQGLKAPASF